VIREHDLTRLQADSNRLTDYGGRLLAHMPQLQQLDLGGPKGVLTDRVLDVLRDLPELRRFSGRGSRTCQTPASRISRSAITSNAWT
jgi:hypothetical protein